MSETQAIPNLNKLKKNSIAKHIPAKKNTNIIANLTKEQSFATKLVSNIKTEKNEVVSPDDFYSSLRMLAEVIDLIERKGFRNVNFRKFIEEALTAAVPYVDAHSAFFSRKSFDETRATTSGEFSGIGITVMSKATNADELVVTEAIADGPSYKAGIQTADKIIAINGEKLRGMSSDDVVNKLRGVVNSIVKLKVIRDNKLLEFDVKREMIKNQVATSYYFEDQNILYLGLRLFTENATQNIMEQFNKVNKNCKGMILDLRKNSGGILDSVVGTAGLFLKKGSLVVSTRNKDGKTIAEYKTTTNPIIKNDMPIFLLIDNFTASAAEILAGCLKYYASTKDEKLNSRPMVFLLGATTFGKGSVQEVIPISNGCALKLTTMLYDLPGKVSIQATGIKPDFAIKPRIVPEQELKLMEEFIGNESSLKYHIKREEALKGLSQKDEPKVEAKKEDENWESKFKNNILKDIHIQKAASMISLISMAKKHSPAKVETREKALAFLHKSLLTDDTVGIKKIN